MNTLTEIQHGFQNYLLGALPDAKATPAAGAGHDAAMAADAGAPPIVAAVRAQSGLPAAERLAIYHRAYRARLREALCAAYDKTWSYIGDEMFGELADAYLATHPSSHPNLRWFGAELAAQARLAFPEYPFIAELAQLEWALGLAFDAEDAPALTRADLAAVAPQAWSELGFSLHPSARLLAMEWNSAALWQAMAAGRDAPEPAALAAPTHWLVWRHAGQPHFRSLTDLEAQALQRIGAGWPFGAVCGAACAASADADATMLSLAGHLQHWMTQELLSARA